MRPQSCYNGQLPLGGIGKDVRRGSIRKKRLEPANEKNPVQSKKRQKQQLPDGILKDTRLAAEFFPLL